MNSTICSFETVCRHF